MTITWYVVRASGLVAFAVLTSSVVGSKAFANTGDYGVSKAGVGHLAKIASSEHLADGIRVSRADCRTVLAGTIRSTRQITCLPACAISRSK